MQSGPAKPRGTAPEPFLRRRTLIDTRGVLGKLQGLTQDKNVPFARENPIMRGYGFEEERKVYGGAVVNVAQDVAIFAASLPQLGADFPSICVHQSDG